MTNPTFTFTSAEPIVLDIAPRQTIVLTVAETGAKGEDGVSLTPSRNIVVLTGAAPGAVVDVPGYLCSVTVTEIGSDPLIFSDGPTGPVIAIVNANQPTGDLPISTKRFASSLYVASTPNTPAVTIGVA